MAIQCVDCGRGLSDTEATFNVTRCDFCTKRQAGDFAERVSQDDKDEGRSTGTVTPEENRDELLRTAAEPMTKEERDDLLGTAFVSPWWISSAPSAVQAFLSLVTLPGIMLGLLMYLLAPVAWLANILTGHRLNSTWGVLLIRVLRPPILLIVPTWLLSVLWPPLALPMFIWMLVYLILRQFNGAADHERRLFKLMEAEEKLLDRLGGD